MVIGIERKGPSSIYGQFNNRRTEVYDCDYFVIFIEHFINLRHEIFKIKLFVQFFVHYRLFYSFKRFAVRFVI